ncbi:MAG: UDP-glucose dehydrogenase family protein [Burkholderiales bacterium]
MPSIAIFGAGYVGIVTAVSLAHLRHNVICYDSDLAKIHALRAGAPTIHEPGLEALLLSGLRSGRFRTTSLASEALERCDIAFIAVGTPTGPTGEADLTYVRQAAKTIALHANDGLLVVNKSTVPVETADLVARIIATHARTEGIRVASNPEFLREGSAVQDFFHPERIVIGVESPGDERKLRDLYASIDAPVIAVDLHTAEMIKYAANAFLATKISFINEIANLCGEVGASIDGVLHGIGCDPRIGTAYLRPGLGFGGSCLPKDVAALAHVARMHAIEPTMMDAVLNVNRRQISVAMRLIQEQCGDLDGQSITLLGIAFKAGTDDLRGSPAVALARALLSHGASVTVHDPYALPHARSVLGDEVRYAFELTQACDGADAIVVATEAPEYAGACWEQLRAHVGSALLFDMRNVIDPQVALEAGFSYYGIGRRGGRQPVAS